MMIGGPTAMLVLVALSGVATGLVALAVAQRMGWRRTVPMWLLVWSLACLVVITLVPSSTATPVVVHTEVCSFDYDGPAPDGFWIIPGGQRLLNTLVFIPSGALLVWTLGQFRRGLRWVLPGLLALAGCSVAIELAQQKVSRLGRACDVTDMVDNTLGAIIGVVLGLMAVGVARLVKPRR